MDLNLSSEIFECSHIQRLINGAINLFPAKSKPERRPISRELLLKLVSSEATQGESKVDRLNGNAAFTMAFAGFMRMGEFTHNQSSLKDPARFQTENLTRRCVIQSAAEDHYTLFLPRSKTDYNNTGVRIVIAAAEDNACPYLYIKKLLEGNLESLDTPLFRFLSSAFIRERALTTLTKRLRRCRIDPTGIKGHSFRKGAA